MRRAGVVLLLTLVGLGLGAGLGLAIGWIWWPVEYTDTEIADLKGTYQADYVLMVGEAYALTGDLDQARERVGRLGVPDAATLVLAQAEAALTAGASRDEIGHLARLAAALGISSPALVPYLTPIPGQP